MRGLVMVGAVVAIGLGMWGCGGSYSRGHHCTIHPVMVGSINQGTVSQQPCTGAYCN